jgi:Domain of unknown function (DUF4153)
MKQSIAWVIALAALTLGVSGDVLLRTWPWGLNFTIWVVLLAAAITWLMKAARPLMTLAGPPVLFFAVCVLWRASPPLQFVSLCATGTVFLLSYMQWRGIPLGRALVRDYLRAGVTVAQNAAIGGFEFAGHDFPKAAAAGPAIRRAPAIAVGLGVAAPLVVVFGALFAAADARFATMVSEIIRVDIERTIGHCVVIAGLTLASAGVLREFARPSERHQSARAIRFSGIVEVAIPLGAMATVFGIFVALQLGYLFGGADAVLATPGLTLAQYARRGFFELVEASGLVLPLLLVFHRQIDPSMARHQAIFRRLALLQIALVGLVLVSALQRLALYIDAFGLTESRLYGVAFSIWLTAALVWFGANTLRGRPQRFASGAVVAGLGMIALLNVISPAARVARTNIARRVAGAELDVAYLTQLGDDAVPALIEGLGRLDWGDRCRLAAHLRERGQLHAGDWRGWNVARWRAGRALRRNEQVLNRMACEPAGS